MISLQESTAPTHPHNVTNNMIIDLPQLQKRLLYFLTTWSSDLPKSDANSLGSTVRIFA